jgi:hypothetical protein
VALVRPKRGSPERCCGGGYGGAIFLIHRDKGLRRQPGCKNDPGIFLGMNPVAGSPDQLAELLKVRTGGDVISGIPSTTGAKTAICRRKRSRAVPWQPALILSETRADGRCRCRL